MRTKRPGSAGLFLALLLFAMLIASAQADSTKTQPNKVKRTAAPIWSLAMDGSRVGYGSGGKVYVWNMATGATSVIKGSHTRPPYSANAVQIAIAGKRLAWIKATTDIHTSTLRLYAAQLSGAAHRLTSMASTSWMCSEWGTKMSGLVGSGSVLAVSTWTEDSQGPTLSDQRLNRITPAGLRTIATGPDAIGAYASANDGHIALAPPGTLDTDCNRVSATNVNIYGADGTLLHRVETGSSVARVALSGNRLVMDKYPPGLDIPTLDVYNWTTGALVHSWPTKASVSRGYLGDYAVAGHIAVYLDYVRADSDQYYAWTMHLLDLTTGNDVVIGSTHTHDTTAGVALGRRGLLYAVSHWKGSPYHSPGHGKLVFVPMAKLLAMVK